MSGSTAIHRIAILLFCAGLSTWQYVTEALPRCPDCLDTTAKIAAGDYVAPFVYRPLTPQILVWMGNTVQAHILFHFGMLLTFFALLWAWVEFWRGNGLAAVSIATAALYVMWPTYYFSSYAITEWVLWLTGLRLLTWGWLPSERPTGR